MQLILIQHAGEGELSEFEKGFMDITGISILEFKTRSVHLHSAGNNTWTYMGWQLSWHTDNPYYNLRGAIE